MTAVQQFVARFPHQLNTGLLSANFSECRFDRGWGTYNFTEAESALFGFLMFLELFACFSDVIGICLAFAAEVFLTAGTSNSKLTHVNRCISRDNLAWIIFHIIIHFTLDDFHNISTFAMDQIRVQSHELRLLYFLKLFQKIIPEEILYFLLRYVFFTIWTFIFSITSGKANIIRLI